VETTGIFASHAGFKSALPVASFIGFTGTPIERDDMTPCTVFGDYISIYDIQDAVDDGVAVEISYKSSPAKLDVNREQIEKIGEPKDLIHPQKSIGTRKRNQTSATRHFETRNSLGHR
jgi:type I restriction enzyme R subunit